MTLRDGKTKAVPYPNPGYNCSDEYGLAQKDGAKKDVETRYVPYKYGETATFNNLQHCPDFNERMTLRDGKTKAVPYPNPGYNCSDGYGLVQK